jgi:hypothetical protein
METTKRELYRLQARASIPAQRKGRTYTRLHTETRVCVDDEYGQELRLLRHDGSDRQGMGRVSAILVPKDMRGTDHMCCSASWILECSGMRG